MMIMAIAPIGVFCLIVVLTPTEPNFLVSPIAMLPQTKEQKTNGTTSIFINFIKR